MAAEQTVISRRADPDFGALELIETRTQARLNDGPWQAVMFREWSGKREDLGVRVSIANSEDPPLVAGETRSAFRALVANISGFKQMVARSQLGLAKEWATQGGLNLSLDEDVFSGLLAINSFSVEERRLTVFLEEPANIFAGHMIEVRIERGEVVEICLAG